METNIQKMQVLLETVRAGSFTRAAERLSYSQSGVSRMVGDLEADWGFKVLDRSREGVVLSADGRQVMPAVEALCEEFGRLQRRVDEMRGLMRGKICIGTFSSVATHVLPPVIARFRADHPDVDYELLMGDYSEIEQWVAEGRCDLGFIPREPRGAGMASRPLVQDELMAVVPADSSLATAEVVSLADQCDISNGRCFACRRPFPRIPLNVCASLPTLGKSQSPVHFLMKLNFRMRCRVILLPKLNLGSIRIL